MKVNVIKIEYVTQILSLSLLVTFTAAAQSTTQK